MTLLNIGTTEENNDISDPPNRLKQINPPQFNLAFVVDDVPFLPFRTSIFLSLETAQIHGVFELVILI